MGITKTCFFVSISFLNLIQISLGIFHCLQLLKLFKTFEYVFNFTGCCAL